MAELEVPGLCYWNGCIKYRSDGVYYEGPTPKVIKVKRKTELSKLMNDLYRVIGLDTDKQKAKIKIFGRYPTPSVVQQSVVKYLLLPVVNDASLETMLEVPSNHPSLKNVEFYVEVKSDGVTDPAPCSLTNPGCSSKRQRTDVHVKLERDKNSGSDDAVAAQVVNLTEDSSISRNDLNKDSTSGVLKPCLSSLWLDDHDLRVGLCFKDGDELKKAVDWCSINGLRKCLVHKTEKEEYMFECLRWKCKWTLGAAKMEKHGLFEIIKYTGPHTCCPIEPKDCDSVFVADEIERVVRVHPAQSFGDLNKWWERKFGYRLETSEVRDAKEKAIKKVFRDWDQSFEDLPKLMSAFSSSNGLLVEWKYDLFPNPKFASFCGVFWAFSQSIEGFPHCRPVIIVDTKELKGKYPMKLMIASGVNANNGYFPLAFAVTKEVSSDSWRWFLTSIREKVTQRKGLCLISSPNPDLLAVINEPGSLWQEPWAYHRFCLNHLCSQFYRIFPGYYLDNLMKQAVCASQKEEFNSYMKMIQEYNSKAWEWLDQFPQNQWALSHDDGLRYGIMRIDSKLLFAECRGFELDDHVLTGSVLILFDELKDIFDDEVVFSRGCLTEGHVYTKPVTDKLEEFRTSSVTYAVIPLEDNNVFQVTAPPLSNEWIIRLSDATCTCGKFQSNKFPCLHALAVCKKLKINPLQYVDDCYTFERYYKTYSANFSPVPELSAWPEASGVPRLFPPVIPQPPPSPPSLPKVVAGKSQRRAAPKTTQKKS